MALDAAGERDESTSVEMPARIVSRSGNSMRGASSKRPGRRRLD
jgi:hypothetical protein